MIEAFGPLPRPACGERGPFPVSGSADIWEPASAPHPEAARNGAGSDLSPQGGEVTGRAVNSFTTPEMTALIFPAEPAYVLRNATGARALLAQPQSYPGDGETVRLDLAVERGRIVRITPAGAGEERPPVDLDGGMVWPCFTDIHTHLDKGHIWPRSPNPNGRHASALTAVAADRTAHWSTADVAARMRFGVRCAYAHGTRAVRTYIDSTSEQGEISWPVLAAMREECEGRVALQGVSLIAIAAFRDEDGGMRLADLVARHGGILGAATTIEPDLDVLLDRVFALAQGATSISIFTSTRPTIRNLVRLPISR